MTDAPARPRPATAEEKAALQKVQRRVAAIALFVITIHGVLGTIVMAHVVHDQGRTSDAVVLLVMSAVISAVQYAAIRVILKKPLLSWVWIPLSFVPTIVGIVWVLG